MSILGKLINKKMSKVYVYMGFSFITMFLALIINWLMTRMVNPSIYGIYRYATNFLLVIPTFFGFGIHFGASRIIASKKADEKDPIVFTSIFVNALIGVLITILLYISLYLSRILHFNIGALNDITLIFPFMAFFSARIVIAQIYQGTGKTNQLALFNMFQYFIIVLGLLLGIILRFELSFKYLVALYVISWLFVMVPLCLRVNYSFKNFKKNFLVLYYETKSNGIFIYLGSILTSGSASVIAFISGSVYGYAEYGYYALALSFAQAFTVISSTLAVVKFRENVNQKLIPKSDFQLMVLLNITVYIIFLVVLKPLFNLFFTPDYYRTVDYLIFLGVVYSLNGIILYYNRFFIARGFGRETMNNSIFSAAVNIVSSVILIPNYAIMGIVYASLISSSLSLIKYMLSYKKYTKIVLTDNATII